MASDSERLWDAVQAELDEPGAVTKPELRDLLSKHPATTPPLWRPGVFDPFVWR